MLMELKGLMALSLQLRGAMPRGPKGERRPADVIGNAVKVMRTATGEIEATTPPEK